MLQSVLYAQPVHFHNSKTGQWEEIDNTLVEERNSLGETRLVNKQNGMMSVALGTGSKMVEITNEDGETISWTVEGSRARAVSAARKDASPARMGENADFRRNVREKLSQEAVYADMLPGTQMRCHVESTSFKEDIVFETPEAVKPVSFLLDAPGLTLALEDDSSVSIRNARQELSFVMPAPFMVDNDGALGDVSVTLTKQGNDGWRLLYTPNEQWAAGASFPVTLDPAIFLAKHAMAGYVDMANPTKAYATGTRFVTKTTTHRMLFMRFNTAAAMDASFAVTSAVLHMPFTRATGGNATPLFAREILSDWAAGTLTYENQPTISEADVDVAEPTTAATVDYQFNIASLVQKWHTGVNYGLVFDAREDGTHIQQTTSDIPYIVINYAGQAGLESYFTFESHGVGRAGTAHVNLFNGNLVFEHADTATNGSRMPVSLTHYYNACYRDLDIFSAGYGWKHSMHNTIHRETYTELDGKTVTEYYVYTDGDGTRHSFAKTTKPDTHRATDYEDMSGLSLRLAIAQTTNVTTGNTYTPTLYDKGDNYLLFSTMTANSGSRDRHYKLLTQAVDANGNKAVVAVGTKKVGSVDYPIINNITDGAGRKTLLTTNAKGYVETIKAPGYEQSGLQFVYDDGGRLAKITYEDGLSTEFTYDSLNLLTSVTNHDGRKLTIEYEGFAPYRVRRVTESCRETVGNCREYTYDHLKTTVTDRTIPGGKQLIYAFNTYGNLITTHDMLGQAVVAKFSEDEMINHPKSVSKMMRSVINLLRNHSFEKGTCWQLSGPVRYDTQGQMTGERCLCFDSGIAGSAMQAAQTLELMPGTPYVFSFYAKSCGQMALRVAMEYQDALGIKHLLESPVLSRGPLYEYERLFHSFTLPQGSAKTVTLFLRAQGEPGTPSRAWVDCAQLEEGVLPNRYSLLVNGDFSYDCAGRPLGWEPQEDTAQEDTAYIPDDMIGKPGGMTGHVLRLHGQAQNKVGYYQNITLSGQAGDVFLLGGWAKGFAASPDKNGKRKFGLHIAFENDEGEFTDAEPISWATQRNGWQFTCGANIAPENYKTIRLYIDYHDNINEAEFDGLFLHREHFGRSFDYDDNGNVISAQGLTGKKSEAEYDKYDNLIKYRSPGHPKAEVTRMEYGTTDAERMKHLLRRLEGPSGRTEQHTYDTTGNRLTTTVTGPNTADFIKSSAAYADGNNYVKSQTDARGQTSLQEVDPVLGVVKSVTNPVGQVVNYAYDVLRRPTEMATVADGKTCRNTYTYTDRKLTTVSHNTESDEECDVTYHFEYDELGNRTAVSVGDRLLSRSVYSETGDKLLIRTETGNGSKVHYGYDAYKRLTSVGYDNEPAPRYTYDYDASGNIARITDAKRSSVTTYEMDFASRPARMRETVDGKHHLTLETSYDSASRVKKIRETIGEEKTSFETEYAYDSEDRVTQITYENPEQGVTIRYDALSRVTARKLLDGSDGYLVNYTYVQGGQGVGSSTSLVESMVQNGESFEYTYDALGNITRISRNGVETTYAYDALSQLTRVNCPHEGKTTTFAYDRGGNLLKKCIYALTKGELPEAALQEIEYAYADQSWKDKLTSYNGVAITYDAIGNPLHDGTWAYTWQYGRQLQKMECGSAETVAYVYNKDGLRIRKESSSRGTTKYVLSGKQVVHMTREKNGVPEAEMHFYYNERAKPTVCVYNGKRYGYVYNGQGDVMALIDLENGRHQVVTYAYDAWGKFISCTGDLADTLGQENPFRYRSYVYDEETGLYYLRSRYYNPEWGRFVNADSLLTRNLFAYCENAPVKMVDPDGMICLGDPPMQAADGGG